MTEDRIVLGVSDLHGYADTAERFFEDLNGYADRELDGPLVSYDGEVSWEGGDRYTLVFAGDMIDRGPESDAMLEMVFDLQDDAPDGHVRYLMGNHESFALFPDVYEDLYLHHAYDSTKPLEERDTHHWYSMDEDLRGELIERVADGRVEAGFDGPAYDYLHAGGNDEQDIADLNERLQEAGDLLQDGWQDWQDTGDRELYREAQEEVMWFDDGDLAVEDRYEPIFMSDEVRGPDAGILLMDFRYMEDDAPEQVVGHTTGTGLADRDGFDDTNPQRKGDAININTMRDYQSGKGRLAASMETDERLSVLLWDGEDVEEVRV